MEEITTSNQSEASIAWFIRAYGISARAEWIAERPDRKDQGKDEQAWDRSARHFRVTLRCRSTSKRMTVYFSQGSAHTREPEARDVLDCLASDAAGYDNAGDFGNWCSEYGYDGDSRRAERIYRTVKAQAGRLRAFLGEVGYERLLYRTERL